MDIRDATLILMSESADHPALASVARSVYERLVNGDPVDYRLLDQLIGEASGKGVLRALHAKYSPVAYEAIIMPILAELGRLKPIRSQRYAGPADPESDPLLASTWPAREHISR
jgi:hypothetical protein